MQGCAPGSQVQRGGWAAGRGEYRLLVQAAGEAVPRVDKVAFSGLEDELAAFVAQARLQLQNQRSCKRPSASVTPSL